MIESARSHRIHLVCILLTPLLQLAINRNLFINPAGGWIDPWVYTGTFVNFPSHLQMFAGTYYVTRLSWILPGFLAQSVLPALAANYVLHLAFFYALMFATYELVSAGAGRSAAILVAIIMAWNPVIVAALSWDYIDGPGIVFLVVTLSCLEKVAHEGAYRRAWALGAGAGMASMMSSNLFLVVMSPIAFLFFVVRVGFARWRLIGGTVFMAAGGAVAMLAIFGFVNRIYGGAWLFLAPSFATARYIASTPSAWRDYSWHYRATWLALPAVAVFGALLDLVLRDRRSERFALAMQVTLLAATAVWIGFEVRGMPVLQFSYYSSYLAPLALLALPLQAGFRGPSLKRENFVLVIVTVGLFIAAHWLFLTRVPSLAETFGRFTLARRVYDLAWFGPFGPDSFSAFLAVLSGVAAVLWLRFVKGEPARWIGFAVGLALGCAAVPSNWPAASATEAQSSYEQVVSIDRYIDKNVGGRRLRFWYELNSMPEASLRAIASTYFWGYALVNEQLPSLSADEAARLPANTRFVFLVPTHQDISSARDALQNYGLGISLVDQHQFGTGDRQLSVVLADLIRISPSTP